MNGDTLIVGFFAVLVLVAVGIALWPFSRNVPPAGGLALLAVFLSLPALARADNAAPITIPSNFHLGMESGSETLIGLHKGASRHVLVFARAQADMLFKGCLHGWGHVEGSALGDGGAGGVNLQDPNSFTTLEMYVGGYCEVLSGFAIGGLFGGVVDIEKGLPVVTSSPKTYGVNVILGKPYAGKWLLVGYGVHQAAGPGNRILFAAEYELAKNLSVVADGAIRIGPPSDTDASFVRAGLAVHGGKAAN